MTCIVAAVENDAVYMGADSAVTNEGDGYRYKFTTPKLFKKNGLLFGFAGEFKTPSILLYEDWPEIETEDINKYLYELLTKWLFKKCSKYKITSVENEIASAEASLLIGSKDKLFLMDSSFVASEISRQFESIGSGCAYAMGAMHANNSKNINTKLTAGLTAAAYFCNTVGPPNIFMDTKDDA